MPTFSVGIRVMNGGRVTKRASVFIAADSEYDARKEAEKRYPAPRFEIAYVTHTES